MAGIFKDWIGDFYAALGLLTRVSVPFAGSPAQGDIQPDIARAYRAFPLVAALIGLAAGAFHLVLLKVGLPPLGAAALTLGTTALITGALHEDGLADTADGFGGGRDRASKLAIMKDSRIGSYGVLALLVSFATKAASLASLPQVEVIPCLIVTHVLARGALPAMVARLPYAREGGLARSVGTPSQATVITAALLAVAAAFICLPVGIALLAIVAAAIVAAGIAFLALRQIGGITGDVLGAAEQVIEVVLLAMFAAHGTRL